MTQFRKAVPVGILKSAFARTIERAIGHALAVVLVMATLALFAVTPTAQAQDSDSSAIGDLLTQVMPDVGLGQYLPTEAEDPFQSAVDNAEPYDNFNLEPALIDASAIMPIDLSVVEIAPYEAGVGPPSSLLDFISSLNRAPIEPLTPESLDALFDSHIDDGLFRDLIEAGVFNDEPPLDFGPPPDLAEVDGFPQLLPDVQASVTTAFEELWPDEPVAFPPFLRDRTVGPDSPLGCGPHGSYTVLCDPTDPGGSQFGHEFTFVAVELPEPPGSMGPPYENEIVFTFFDPSGEAYQGGFDGDLFNGSNHNFVFRPGSAPEFDHVQWDGSGWPSTPTGARMFHGGNVVGVVLDDTIDFEGFRVSTFLSDGTRQPGRVASYSIPLPTEPLAPFEPAGWIPPPAFDPPDFVFEPGVFISSDDGSSFFLEPETPEEADDTDSAVDQADDTPEETSDTDSAVDQADNTSEEAIPVIPGSNDSSSNTRNILFTVAGGTGILAGAYYFSRKGRGGVLVTNEGESLDGYLLVGDPATDSVDGAYIPRNYDNDVPEPPSLVVENPQDAVEVDNEDRPETPVVELPAENPFPRATGRGSHHRNNRAVQLFEQTGEWVDPSTIALPRLLQKAFDNAPEPPKVITPAMAEARKAMFAAAQQAGLQLPGKAMLTHSYDSYGGLPHMFWTVRVGPDGSILDSYANAEKGGPAASSIMRIEVYPGPDGHWWSAIRLVDTTKSTVYVANSPTAANPGGPAPMPDSAEEAVRLAFTGLVSDGRIVQPMDPRRSR